MMVLSGLISPVIGALGPAAVIGYIAGRSDNATAISYVFVGASLSIMWNNGIFRTGWSLAEEQNAGTLDLMMTTRTPVALIMLGKALAIMAFASLAGIVTFVVVLGISRQVPPVDNAALFLVSGLVALISVIVASFFFAPFSFLAGVRGGFFNAIMPFGAVVSGFLYPIDLLPGSLDGSASDLTVVADLLVALALSAVLLGVSFLLFLKVEQRVRLSGSLGTV
jgi:ABC-type multidrug transport system permease subunit